MSKLQRMITFTLSVFILLNLGFSIENYSSDLSAKPLFEKAYADDDYDDDEEDDDDHDNEDDENDDDNDNENRNRRNYYREEDNYRNDQSLENYNQKLSTPTENTEPVNQELIASTSLINISLPEQPKTTMLASFADNTNLLKNIDTVSENQSIDYYTAELVKRGIISDFDPISYDRFSAATRIDGLRLIMNTIGLSQDEIASESDFFDIDQKAWYSSYIATAKNKNIVKGYEDNTFRPLNGISRSEFLKMIFKAYNVDLNGQYPKIKSFLDEDDLHWSAAYLETAKANNMIRGYGNGTVGPEKTVTKGEIAKMVLLTSKIKNTQNEFKIPEMMSEAERNELKIKRELELERIRLEQEKIANESAKKINTPAPKAPIKPVIPVSTPTPTQNNSAAKEAAAKAEAARIAKEKAAQDAQNRSRRTRRS